MLAQSLNTGATITKLSGTNISNTQDEIIIGSPPAPNDPRDTYKITLVKAALEITKPEYGNYTLFQKPGYMKSARAFVELGKPNGINVYFSITSRARETQAIPIRIPARFGIANYRLLLINKDNRKKFKNIKTTEDLKPLKAGIKSDWVLREIFVRNGFTQVEVQTLNSLYTMLNRGRFDYLVRGINEVFDEIEIREDKLQNVEILPNIALYINTPLYLFVSKTQPRLAQRLERGFEMLRESGEMHALFLAEYQDDIERVDLAHRKIIKIDNPFLPPRTPIDQTELWYDVDSNFGPK